MRKKQCRIEKKKKILEKNVIISIFQVNKTAKHIFSHKCRRIFERIVIQRERWLLSRSPRFIHDVPCYARDKTFHLILVRYQRVACSHYEINTHRK